jgi:hypothetical protein
MRRHARRLLAGGLGVGLVVAGVGAAALWTRAVPGTPHTRPVHAASRAEEPAPGLTPQAIETRRAEVAHAHAGAGEPAPPLRPADLEALRAEVARVHAGMEQLQRRSAAMSRELAALRAQRPGVDQDQAPRGREVRQSAGAGTGVGTTAHTPATTLEDEDAQAQVQTQIEGFEGTLVEEAVDPGWASAVQLALQEAFDRQAMAGLHLVEADCRTSLCRLELVLDGALSPGEAFEPLVHFAPWDGPWFAHIDEASGVAVVYLAREGDALPRARE